MHHRRRVGDIASEALPATDESIASLWGRGHVPAPCTRAGINFEGCRCNLHCSHGRERVRAGCGMQRLEEVLADMGERVESEEDAVALDVAELAALELGQLAVRAPEAKGAQHRHISRMQANPACKNAGPCYAASMWGRTLGAVLHVSAPHMRDSWLRCKILCRLGSGCYAKAPSGDCHGPCRSRKGEHLHPNLCDNKGLYSLQ